MRTEKFRKIRQRKFKGALTREGRPHPGRDHFCRKVRAACRKPLKKMGVESTEVLNAKNQGSVEKHPSCGRRPQRRYHRIHTNMAGRAHWNIMLGGNPNFLQGHLKKLKQDPDLLPDQRRHGTPGTRPEVGTAIFSRYKG